MVVRELIDALSKMDADAKVVVRGFDEMGYLDLSSLSSVLIVKTDTSGTYWTYEDADRLPANRVPLGEKFTAILIDS